MSCRSRWPSADCAAEIDAGRRTLIASLGFDVVDPAAAELDAGDADVVFEVSGAAAAVRSATALAKVRGTVVVVAIHPAPREVDLHRVFWRELRLLGARVYQRSDFERAIQLLHQGVIPAAELISGVVPLEETATAIRDLSAGPGMKILVDVAGKDQA